MPIVLHLRNKHLQDYHKAEIRRVVGRPNFDYEHEDFKLRDLIDMEINKHLEEIQEISTQATQEANL